MNLNEPKSRFIFFACTLRNTNGQHVTKRDRAGQVGTQRDKHGQTGTIGDNKGQSTNNK